MATKTNTKDMSDNTDEANDAPLAGSGNLADAIKKLLKKGKERGHVTLDELNAILPPERISSELIEDVMAQLNDMGINVVEGEESEDDPENTAEGKAAEAEDYGRTDDPVRLYLREMGAVELLSREGEIAIAKRIEAGREMMISGICDSPLTIQAILDWNEALKAGRLLLRDIIDLDATQDSPETAAESPGVAAADSDRGDAVTDAAVKSVAQPNSPKADDDETATTAEGGDSDDSSFEDEDNISLAAIEEKLKPQVIETFDAIAATYVKLNKLQHQRLVAIEKGEQPNKANDTKIVGYKEQLVEIVRTVRFNNARLEQLVQQLYTLNRRLMGLEGRLLRYGLDVQLSRDEFLERYYEHELDPNWFDHILQPPPPPKPQPKAEPRIVENASARMLAHAQRQREAAAKEAAKQKIIDDKAAIAQAKRDEIARAKAVIAEQKAAAKEAVIALKAQEKEKVQKAAAAAKDAAAKQKAKDEAQKQRDKAQADAARQRDAASKLKAKEQAQKQREKAQADAARQREAAAKLKAKEQAQKQREKAQADAARQREAAAKLKAKAKPVAKAAAKPVAKPAAKKAPAKTAAKPVAKKAVPTAKKPAAKPAAKTPVKATAKPAAIKMAVTSSSKSSAKKPAAKPAAKLTGGKTASKSSPTKSNRKR